MIQASALNSASFEIRRKAKACHAHERGNKVYVLPFDESKDRRIVLFLEVGILCFSTDGTACEANSFRSVCYHVLSAVRRREINRKRRATIQRKRSQAA